MTSNYRRSSIRSTLSKTFAALFGPAGTIIASLLLAVATVYFTDKKSATRPVLAFDYRTEIQGNVQIFFDVGSGFNERDSSRALRNLRIVGSDLTTRPIVLSAIHPQNQIRLIRENDGQLEITTAQGANDPSLIVDLPGGFVVTVNGYPGPTSPRTTRSRPWRSTGQANTGSLSGIGLLT